MQNFQMIGRICRGIERGEINFISYPATRVHYEEIYHMNLIIAGSRQFIDYSLLVDEVDKLIESSPNFGVSIISGMANGADLLGVLYAEHHNIPCKKFPANWDKYGKSAGMIRNKEMAQNGTYLIAFWDGESRGTKQMIDCALENKLDVTVVYYKNYRRNNA